MQLEAKGERPGTFASHQDDRGLDSTGTRLAGRHPEHGHRRGPSPGALDRPARIAAAQLSNSMRPGDGLRNHPGRLRGQRKPAQVCRRAVPVEHLDARIHKAPQRQPRIPGPTGCARHAHAGRRV